MTPERHPYGDGSGELYAAVHEARRRLDDAHLRHLESEAGWHEDVAGMRAYYQSDIKPYVAGAKRSDDRFHSCMVQGNTANWDAVEARDTSYIHSTNGVNCFTGDIHYGDVTPPKEATCTMLPDPYASYVVPSNNPCTYTNKQMNNTNATLTPGTYCGGIKIYRQLDCDVHAWRLLHPERRLHVADSANAPATG